VFIIEVDKGMNKIIKTIMVIMLIASLAGIALADSLDATSGNTVTQSRLADIVANDYNSKSTSEQQAQVTLTRVTGNTVPQSRTADIVSYDVANSYDGGGSSSSSYVPTDIPEVTSAPAEITNIPLLDIIPTPTDTPAPTPAPTITPSKGIRKAMQEKGVDYDLQLSGNEEVLWGNFCFNVTPQGSEIRIKGVVHTQLCPSRDFKPGSYLINVSHEGYYNFSQVITLTDEELKSVNVSLEPIQEIPVVPATIPDQNGSVTGQTENNTSAIPTSHNDDGGLSYLKAMLAIFVMAAIGTLIVLKLPKKTTGSQDNVSGEGMTDDDISVEDQQKMVLGLIKNNPNITNAEICTKIGISDRTLSRRISELKKDQRL